jgi:hypothetical protein
MNAKAKVESIICRFQAVKPLSEMFQLQILSFAS